MSWQVQTAKAKFSELLRAARQQGPQTITVRGKAEFVIVAKAQFETFEARKRRKSWEELFAPVRGLDLEPRPRDPEPVREIGLGED